MLRFAVGVGLLACACSTSSGPVCSPAESLDASAYTASELPSGACSGAPSCGYLVARSCASGPAPIDRWTCTCDGGKWSCSVTSAATTICASDAGTD
ncbi:MAG TPA: hypothetical protein VGH28_22610 [Polyangiaceae bacterium]